MKKITEISKCTEYLSALKRIKRRYLIVITVANRPGKYINSEIDERLKELGLKKSLVGLIHKGYIAIIDKGDVIYETLSMTNEPVYYYQTYSHVEDQNEIALRISSKTAYQGGRSEIIIEDNELCVNSVGLNIVVYDTEVRAVIDAVGFSTDVPQLYCTRLQQDVNDKLEKLNEFNAMKYGVARWCSEKGYKNVVIYSEKQYEALIRAVMLSFSIENKLVRLFFSSETFEIRIRREFLGIFNFSKLDPSQLNKEDIVLIITPFPNYGLADQMKPHCSLVIQLNELLRYVNKHLYEVRPLIQFKNLHPNISVITVTAPIWQSDMEKHSQFEKFIKEKHITRGTLRSWLQQGVKLPHFYEEIFDYSDNDVSTLLNVPERYYTNDGRKEFVAKEYNKYLSCGKNSRITIGVPDYPKRTIFLLGDCRWFGVNAPNDQTIASHLQTLFNKNIKDEQIAVENRGDFIAGKLNDFYQTLHLLPVSDGDIVIIASSSKNDYFPHIDMQKLFERPHSFGEVWFETQHYSEYGHKAIAEQLFHELNENDYFQDSNFDTTTVTIEDIHHSFGMPAVFTNNQEVLSNKDTYNELLVYKSYLAKIKKDEEGIIGAIVMNCNPFTLGHRFLIEYAASKVKRLYIFAVEEDKSFFPFKDRIELIKAGTKDIKNVTVLHSGQFIISTLTFADYFNKAEIQEQTIDPSQDVTIFAKEIAPILGITIRFAGEEPLDKITKQYNESLKRILPRFGIDFELISRKEYDGEPISASRVRRLLEEENFDEIAKIVPETTLIYLKERRIGKD